jgi:hypothetical protein
MSLGIENTLATFADLQSLAVDGIRLAKRGPWGFGTLARVVGIINDVKNLVADATAALPELSDLEAVMGAIVE